MFKKMTVMLIAFTFLTIAVGNMTTVHPKAPSSDDFYTKVFASR